MLDLNVLLPELGQITLCMSVQCFVDYFRRDAALDDLAVKPITQFPVTLDDEVRIHILVVDWFLHYLMTLFCP